MTRRASSERRKGAPAAAREPFPVAVLPWLLAVLFLAGALFRFDPDLSLNGDNAQFLILGESIATGQGYRQINEPVPPAHTKYPFLFPLLLAGTHLIAPGNVVVPKVLVLLLGAGAVYLLVRLLSSTLSVPAVAAWGALTALNPQLLDFSHQVLSEIPYLFFSALALLLFAVWEKRGGRRAFAIAVIAVVAAYYTRTVGVALAAAFVLRLLFIRRFRYAAILAVVFVAAVTPWAVRNRTAEGGESYVRQFLLQNPYDPEGKKLTAGYFFGKRVRANAETYGAYEIGRSVAPSLFPPLKPKSFGGTGFLSAIVTVIALLGLVLRLRAGPGALELYTGAYLAICLAWPEVWASIRFLLPVIPMILYYFGVGVVRTLGRIPRVPMKPVLAVLLFLLLVGEAESNVRAGFAPRGYPAPWRNYFAVADWVRTETPEPSVICCRKPYLFYVRARRRTVSYLWSRDPDSVFEEMIADQVNYVVVAHLSATTGRYLVPAVQKHEDRFDVVLHLPNPDTYLLRLREEEQP
ncbi:MAG: hypothetical protein JW958_11055 [Candidatus Eisenbacteria bacterium]|nr:hypothetical protein [Candidatus Eisenbacteria bacterium]